MVGSSAQYQEWITELKLWNFRQPLQTEHHAGFDWIREINVDFSRGIQNPLVRERALDVAAIVNTSRLREIDDPRQPAEVLGGTISGRVSEDRTDITIQLFNRDFYRVQTIRVVF